MVGSIQQKEQVAAASSSSSGTVKAVPAAKTCSRNRTDTGTYENTRKTSENEGQTVPKRVFGW
jgi:hypothetical protein